MSRKIGRLEEISDHCCVSSFLISPEDFAFCKPELCFVIINEELYAFPDQYSLPLRHIPPRVVIMTCFIQNWPGCSSILHTTFPSEYRECTNRDIYMLVPIISSTTLCKRGTLLVRVRRQSDIHITQMYRTHDLLASSGFRQNHCSVYVIVPTTITRNGVQTSVSTVSYEWMGFIALP